MTGPILFRTRFIGNFMPDSADPRIEPLKASWMRAFPDAEPNATIDFEDWVENAVRLHTALKLAPKRVALVDEAHQAHYLDGTPVPVCRDSLYLGAWHRQDIAAQDQGVFAKYAYPDAFRGESDLALNYVHSQTFQARAGRELYLCGVCDEQAKPVPLDLYDCLAEMYRKGHREVIIKVNRAKYAIRRFKLEADTRKGAQASLLAQDDGFCWSTVHLAGDPHAFIVQAVIPMNYEYRVIVVKHGAVAGAGCVEAFTPLDNEALWDPKMELQRSQTPVTAQHELAHQYMMFARNFTQAYQAERPGNGNYTLDLAVSDGRIVVVELNPLQNYGLYAMDYEAILAAQLYR